MASDFTPVFSASPWQIREALNRQGLRDAVESAIANADQRTKDGWQFAKEFWPDNPLIASVAAGLGKSPEDVKALFDLAVKL